MSESENYFNKVFFSISNALHLVGETKLIHNFERKKQISNY